MAVSRKTKAFSALALILLVGLAGVAVFLIMKYKIRIRREGFMSYPMYTFPDVSAFSSCSPYSVSFLNDKVQRVFLNGQAYNYRLIVSIPQILNRPGRFDVQSFTIPKNVYYQLLIMDNNLPDSAFARPKDNDKNWKISSTPTVITVPQNMKVSDNLVYVIFFKEIVTQQSHY